MSFFFSSENGILWTSDCFVTSDENDITAHFMMFQLRLGEKNLIWLLTFLFILFIAIALISLLIFHVSFNNPTSETESVA